MCACFNFNERLVISDYSNTYIKASPHINVHKIGFDCYKINLKNSECNVF